MGNQVTSGSPSFDKTLFCSPNHLIKHHAFDEAGVARHLLIAHQEAYKLWIFHFMDLLHACVQRSHARKATCQRIRPPTPGEHLATMSRTERSRIVGREYGGAEKGSE